VSAYPLAAEVDYSSPTLTAGSYTYIAAGHPAGTIFLDINNSDTSHLALAVTVEPDATGYVTIPPTVGLTNVAYVVQVDYKFLTALAAPTGDVGINETNCTYVSKFYVAAVVGGSTLVTTRALVTPTNPLLSCVFMLGISGSHTGSISYLATTIVSPTYLGVPVLTGRREVGLRDQFAKMRARLDCWEKIFAEQEDSGLNLPADYYCLDEDETAKVHRLCARLKPKSTECEGFVAVGQQLPPLSKAAALSVEDFDVVVPEGGGPGLKVSEARLALERAAWERRLQRGEGLAWRVNGDTKSPAS